MKATQLTIVAIVVWIWAYAHAEAGQAVAMQLPPGRYRATADVEGVSKAVSFTVGTGARDVMIRFPEITEGGAQPL